MISRDCSTPSLGSLSATVSAHTTLKIAVIHDDARAATHARTALNELEKVVTNKIAVGATLWRFELLECVAWRCRATAEINVADVLIVALSRPDAVPKDISRWMETCFDRLQHRKAIVVGLFGQEFSWVVSPKAAVAAPTDAINAFLESQMAAA